MPKQSKRSKKQSSLLGFFQSSSPSGPKANDRNARKTRAKVSNPSPSKRRLGTQVEDNYATNTSENSDDVGGIRFEAEVNSLSDSDDDVKTSPRRLPIKKRRVKASESSSSSSSEHSGSDEEKIGIPVGWKGKGKGKAVEKRKLAVHDSESEEEPQPKKRKLVRGVRPPTPDESEDLMDEVDQERVIESRFRKRDKKSTFLQNLEKLKRKKRGQSAPSESEQESEDGVEEGPVIIPFAHARPSKGGDNSDDSDNDDEPASENEETFIVEDDLTIELPAEFSMSTHQDLKHHFKIICQLFVHLAVQDPSDRRSFMEDSIKSEYFSVPLHVARRKLSGMRDSLVASSVWRPHFKKPLETLPNFEIIQMDFAEPGCDACHLGGRLSTRQARVSGEPYDKLSFEPLAETDGSSGEDASDEESLRGRRKKEFHLGRFCARRARVFHSFTHWEHALFKALDDEVQGLRNRHANRAKGKKVFIPVAFAGGAVPPEDTNDADGIMNWLDQRHVIDLQWTAIKKMMDDARNLEMAAKKGDDDD
ncbi:hypothetical protein QCA50_002980 [Cerrena zonata]|uniref:DUF4211 domain-containing protein n=1 Tax=Cerrena zonata TaxID=2478898 RepID=A0AAW0GL92_9APHY